MKLISLERLLTIQCREFTSGQALISRDVVAVCQGVKLLTVVHRKHAYIGLDELGIPQWGETYTWVFKGYNGEREVMNTWSQWASDKNTGE